ncbi:MAG: cyclopropane fatty acyl phospholipid synthase [Proteobacteria bacterium]|nr:cyclopropane fatty acyl phospholipid synthase [Pseudomonadota bacterium]
MANVNTEMDSSARKAPDSPTYRLVADLLAKADITLNGTRPWDMRLHDPRALERVLATVNLGLGEAYMDGQWDCDRLDEFFTRVLRAKLDQQIEPTRLFFYVLKAKWLNRQNVKRAWQVGEQHYDLNNEFYEAMLGKRMAYSCGYWSGGSKTLDEAQEAKLDMICRKLALKPGMRLLDIGCGWGSLMGFAAERYGVSCVGVTVSKEQAKLGAARYKDQPIEFRLMDYRNLNEQFDCIASVGMFEHVGPKNYRTYMEVARRCLADGGLFLLHTIGKNHPSAAADPWIDKYIFPNGVIPVIGEIANAASKLFVVEDLHNFGADYDRTLMAWHANFESAWPRFAAKMGQRFYRMWRYYLLSCAGAFRARDTQLWQWVLSKSGVPGGYKRPAV